MKTRYLKIICCALFLFTAAAVQASDVIDQHRPDNISDLKWNGLKSAVQEAKLTASDGTSKLVFGVSVSLWGDRALIGATNGGSDRALIGATSGGDDFGVNLEAAYIFDFDGSSWSQSAKLTASDGASGDLFGGSVSLWGDRALVGAAGDDENGINLGAAYIFDFDGSSWFESAKLTASDGAAFDVFGLSLSLWGDRALIGSDSDGGNGTRSGAAYVFDFDGSSWSQSAKLTASNAAAIDLFGRSVSLWGDRALIGAEGDDENTSNSGAAFIFDFDGSSWSESAKLKASNGASGDRFSSSVSLWGDRALIAAEGDDENGRNSGAAYIFDFDGSSWSESAKLTESDNNLGDRFGISVSLSGDRALIGADGDGDNGTSLDSAYIFDFDGSSWSESAKLTASDAALNDNFGWSVSLSGGRALIGAPFDDNNASDSGSAYVFDLIPEFNVNVSVTGLAATNSVSFENGPDTLTLNADGTGTISTLNDGSAYSLSITVQPDTPSQTCTIADATGTLAGSDVTIAVTCAKDTFTVGGSVSGLTGTGLTLQNNAGDDLLITADGSFTFNTALADLSNYAVIVSTQPNTPTQSCTVSNGSGQINGENVTNVSVDCETREPEITLSSTTIDFGAVNVNTTESIVINATNTGNTDLEISTVSAPSAPFTLIGNGCLSAPIVPPGEACELEIAFNPITTGNFNEVVSITSNAATSPDQISINGSGSTAGSGTPVNVPTLNIWMLMLLGTLMLSLAVMYRRYIN
ncbi:choice-of-anchor D domain-containing protein [Marinicella sp. W31]|uniref:choice-of-anchor D domain-containing protein n=1 Tax=Marinicella sp. W31 TaxID=3023713 RepID=UPI003757632D